jgi:hypothetical protein
VSAVRELFVERFGEANAAAIEAAAEKHANGVNSNNRGSDPFRWAICICIGYECITEYSEENGIKADPAEIRAWVVEHGDLRNHDGDLDYLGLMVGAYGPWMPEAVAE